MVLGCAACCCAAGDSEAQKNVEWRASDADMQEEALAPLTPAAVKAPFGENGSGFEEVSPCGSSDGYNFRVEVTRESKHTSFGIKFDKNDQRSLEIIWAASGGEDNPTPVGEYNKGAENHLRLEPGRFVTAVNGQSGSARAMEKEWVSSNTVIMNVCQPRHFTIELDKTEGSKLGIDVDCCKMGNSIILVGLAEGLIQSWNEKNAGDPRAQVEVLDRIVAVNGERMQSDQLLQALKMARGKVQLFMSRPIWRDGAEGEGDARIF